MPAYRQLGLARFALDDFEAAKVALEHALKLGDDDADSKACLEKVTAALGSSGGAEVPDAVEVPVADPEAN